MKNTSQSTALVPLTFRFLPVSVLGLAVIFAAMLGLRGSVVKPGQVEAQIRSFGAQIAQQLTPTSQFQRVEQPMAGYLPQIKTEMPQAPAGLKPVEQQAWMAFAQRDAGLTPLFPERYSQGTEVRGQGMVVILKPLGSNGAQARVEQGKMVYHGAYTATDSLQVATAGRSEEFLLLHDASAPTRFEYELTGVSGVKEVSLKDGAIYLKGAKGRELQIEAPWLVESGAAQSVAAVYDRRAGALSQIVGGSFGFAQDRRRPPLQGERSSAKVHWELTAAKAGQAWPMLALVVNDAKALRYPVVIDPTVVIPKWTTTLGQLTTARYQQTATLLNNGMVLVAGGEGASGPLASAELYNPATGAWTATGSLNAARMGPSATLLTNGQVLVAGGADASDNPIASSELYDPTTCTWTTTTGSLHTARFVHSATLLPNGQVLVAGGIDPSLHKTATAELYNPATGTWTATTGSLHTARFLHTATLLPNGQVLVAGGVDSSNSASASSELYNPAADSWAQTTGSLNTGRLFHTATLLATGQVLVAGGSDINDNPVVNSELYDPAAQTWTATTHPLNTGRYNHSATLLPNGQVLAAGGATDSAGDITATAELYDPVAGTWTATTTPLNHEREYHTATLLANGQVLVAGGSDITNIILASSELYDSSAGAWTTQAATTGVTHINGTATLLPNGLVLVTSGWDSGGEPSTAAELYDPAAKTWTLTGSLHHGRRYAVATLLANGQVLVTGGVVDATSASDLEATEVYDPSTGQWTLVGPLNTARKDYTATLLSNGQVLVAGGTDEEDDFYPTSELYDPVAKTWSYTTGSLNQIHAYHTATLLGNGKVLLAGGVIDGSGAAAGTATATAELYDPATQTWTVTGSLTTARDSHTATLLPKGQVLVAGGVDSAGNGLASTELYDPGTGTWATTGSLNTARVSYITTLLANGEVLVAGGWKNFGGSSGGTVIAAELYNPATGVWTTTGSMDPAHDDVVGATATLLPNGQVIECAGFDSDQAVEIFDPGLGFTAATQPVVNALANTQLTAGGALTLTGTGFTGVSEASGGTTSSSPSNIPVVQLQSLVNEKIVDLAVDPAHGFSATSVVTQPLHGLPSGYALLSVMVNGTPSQAQIVSIQQLQQTIGAFASIADRAYNSGSFTVAAPTATSGLPVTLSVLSGPATIDSSNNVTLTGAGTVVLAAHQAGNGIYQFAPQVTTSFGVTPAAQTLGAFPIIPDHVYGDVPFTVTPPTASSGLPVTLSVQAGSPATINADNSVFITGAGVVTVLADQAGNANYTAAGAVSTSFVINKGHAAIIFPTIANSAVGLMATLNGSTTAGVPVLFRVLVTAVYTGKGTISGEQITFTAAGKIKLQAYDAATANYLADHEVQDVTVKPGSQTITFPTVSATKVGQTVTLAATTSSGLPITYSIVSAAGYTGTGTISGNTLTLTGAGKIKLAADQPGNANYNAAAEVRQNVNVGMGSQAITFPVVSSPKVGDTVTLAATTPSGLTITYSVIPATGYTGTATITGNSITFTGAGHIKLAADQAGNANYIAAEVRQNVVITGH